MRKIIAAAASAQGLTGEELRGHTVDVVFADGSRNAVYFGSNGQATITAPTGERATGNWYVRNNQLCLGASGATECWGYANRFAAGQTINLTSTCDTASQWTARSVNPEQEVMPEMRGERG